MQDKMPVLFVGHGSPMNAIENNAYVAEWERIAQKIGKPKAILSVSAHWVTRGTKISDAAKPKTVYDMYGFPQELYRVTYDAPGAPEQAQQILGMAGMQVGVDNSWGLDHGTWSVLCRMYPEADIPVCQLGIDRQASMEAHVDMGARLGRLREEGVLILGSGNVVHNLSLVNFGMEDGYPWADAFDAYVKTGIVDRQYEKVIRYQEAGASARQAFVTTEHYVPLLYVLGASRPEDTLTVFNDARVMGSLSMTGYLFA